MMALMFAFFSRRAIIRGGRDRLGFFRHFLQARFLDFGDVQFADIGARGAGFRANAAAPSRPDNPNIDLLHFSSAQKSRDSANRSSPARACRNTTVSIYVS